jgi:hypothetical protein
MKFIDMGLLEIFLSSSGLKTDRAIEISKERLVYVLIKNRKAEIALIIPPMKEKTDEIF